MKSKQIEQKQKLFATKFTIDSQPFGSRFAF